MKGQFGWRSIAVKLGGLGVIAVVAVLLPVWSVLTTQQSQVEVSRHELAGIPPLASTLELIRRLQTERGLATRAAAGEPVELDAASAAADAQLRQLGADLAAQPDFVESNSRLARLQQM